MCTLSDTLFSHPETSGFAEEAYSVLRVSCCSSAVSSDTAGYLIQHFWGAWRFGSRWKSGSVPLLRSARSLSAGWCPVTQRSRKVTVVQTHFLKSDTLAKKLFSSAGRNDQEHGQCFLLSLVHGFEVRKAHLWGWQQKNLIPHFGLQRWSILSFFFSV